MIWRKIATITAWICGLSVILYSFLKKYLHHYFWAFIVIAGGSLILSLLAEAIVFFQKKNITSNKNKKHE